MFLANGLRRISILSSKPHSFVSSIWLDPHVWFPYVLAGAVCLLLVIAMAIIVKRK